MKILMKLIKNLKYFKKNTKKNILKDLFKIFKTNKINCYRKIFIQIKIKQILRRYAKII